MEPGTRNPKPETQNPDTRKPRPEDHKPRTETSDLRPQPPNPKHQTLKSESHTTNPKYETRYPELTEMCRGSEAGWYLRLIDFVYHSTLSSRVIKMEKRKTRNMKPGTPSNSQLIVVVGFL
jgi:hypothetical protein